MSISLIFYNIFVVPILWILFRLGGIVNKKINRGIQGRTNLFKDLQKNISGLHGTKRLWFHASSLGEFEQAKPIIAEIIKYYPQVDIIATFFSPSGFENSKNYQLVNVISYIPFDSYHGVRQFIEIVKPDVAIMVRYDIWPNMIYALSQKRIPTVIANATMRKNSLRKRFPFISFHRSLYNCFTHILTVSKSDEASFREFRTSVPLIETIGDTRFDQVLLRSNDARQKHLLSKNITDNKKLFIVGQSWAEDDDVIIPVMVKIQKGDSSLLTLFVPHEPTVEHLEELESKLDGRCSSIRFSEMNNYNNQNVILIDSIGVLVALYQYAHVVFVGGSFRQGVHNVLEPAIFGVPVIYGPKHFNSQEAVELAHQGGGFVVQDGKALYRILRVFLENPTAQSTAGRISEIFVHEHCGATKRFLHYIQPYLK